MNKREKERRERAKLSQNASEKKSNDSFQNEIKCSKCFGTFKNVHK